MRPIVEHGPCDGYWWSIAHAERVFSTLGLAEADNRLSLASRDSLQMDGYSRTDKVKDVMPAFQ